MDKFSKSLILLRKIIESNSSKETLDEIIVFLEKHEPKKEIQPENQTTIFDQGA